MVLINNRSRHAPAAQISGPRLSQTPFRAGSASNPSPRRCDSSQTAPTRVLAQHGACHRSGDARPASSTGRSPTAFDEHRCLANSHQSWLLSTFALTGSNPPAPATPARQTSVRNTIHEGVLPPGRRSPATSTRPARRQPDPAIPPARSQPHDQSPPYRIRLIPRLRLPHSSVRGSRGRGWAQAAPPE